MPSTCCTSHCMSCRRSSLSCRPRGGRRASELREHPTRTRADPPTPGGVDLADLAVVQEAGDAREVAEVGRVGAGAAGREDVADATRRQTSATDAGAATYDAINPPDCRVGWKPHGVGAAAAGLGARSELWS